MNLKVGTGLRGFMGFVSVVVWLGIWLTGFDMVHWVLYIPGALLAFGAITGICPGLGLWRKILGEG